MSISTLTYMYRWTTSQQSILRVGVEENQAKNRLNSTSIDYNAKQTEPDEAKRSQTKPKPNQPK
jgi:hypothetical protein